MVRWHRINSFCWLRCRSSNDTHHFYRLLSRRTNNWKTSTSFVLPSGKPRTKLYREPPVANDISRRLGRTFIYLFGLALSLVGLGALHIFHWICHQELKREVTWKDRNHDPRVHNMRVPRLEKTDAFCSDQRFAANPSSSPYSGHISDLPKFRTSAPNYTLQPVYLVELDGRHVIIPMAATRKPSCFHLTTLLWDIFDTGSPFVWTDTQLNCSHFTSGFSQMCITCWLNSTDGWVFGPCLMLLDNDYCLSTGHRGQTKSSIKCQSLLRSNAPSQSLGLHDLFASVPAYATQHSVHRSNVTDFAPLFHKPGPDSPVDPRDPMLSSTRSSGDGAPSLNENQLFDTVHSKPKDFGNRVLFYPDRSTFTDLSGPNKRPPHFSSSTHSRSGMGADVAHELGVQDSKPCDAYFDLEHGTPPNYHPFAGYSMPTNFPYSANSSSSNLLDNDGLEYDDFTSLYPDQHECIDFRNFSDLEESQLALVLDTLTSALNPMRDVFNEDAERLVPPEMKENYVKADRELLQNKFAELTQTATDLSDDLLNLEVVLHRLDYRTKAAQIELTQAEDNLDYVWYLRENLEGSSIGSSRQTSCASDMSILGENSFNEVSVSKGPQTFQLPNIRSPSPCFSEQRYSILPASENPLPVESPVLDEIPNEKSQSGPCVTLPSCMTSSMPASTFSRSACNTQSQNVRWRGSNPTVKRYVKKHRRLTIPSFALDTSHCPEGDGQTVKSDDFLYPELTFDNDGIVDWMETTAITPRTRSPDAMKLD